MRMLVNGESSGVMSPLDRGLAYGDGLFESVRFIGADAPLWSRHMDRLGEGCRRLNLPEPDLGLVWHEAREVSRELAQSVVRITLTRGVGERGYSPPAAPAPTRIVTAFEAPLMAGDAYASGLQMRVCTLRLAAQPALAGIKHLNRLEQVLARAEWNDASIAEGLLCDEAGHAICATMANLFAVLDGELCTPSLARCGVAGVARAEVLATCPQVRIGEITVADLRGAEEVFLTSSVRGILPVRELDNHVYPVGPTTRMLQQHWQDLGFFMEQAL
jgi:4-amino-4-deoxychorismate lyase